MTSVSPFREEVEGVAPDRDGWPDHETGASPAGEAAPAETPFVGEGEAWQEWGEPDATELLALESERSHPILSVFALPGAVLDALSGGLSSLAVGLAVSAGYGDVGQLTNILFYFRHPDLIGRKIEPGQRALAAEWISIRDQIVKPALQSIGTAPPPTSTGAPAATAASPDVRPDALSSSRLIWPGSSAAELTFMRAVYDRQARRSKGSFVTDLPKSALDPIEGHEARKDAARAAKELLADARAALAAEHPKARIGILSAYRPATRQFAIWQGRNPKGKDRGSGFPYYYREAIEKGIVRAGDYGPEAVDKVARYLGGYIASPGYSNHQDGLAFDWGVGEVGGRLGKLRKDSWFHRWLKQHAQRFGFRPLATEPWHWTYQPPAQDSEVAVGEVASPAVRASRLEVPRVPLLSRHRGSPPDLILRWNDMPSVPDEIDVVVHLHGFWYRGMKLPRDIEPVSGLDLAPIEGAAGQGRSRPTLTVLPRGDDTGVRQKYKQKDGSYRYGYNVMAFPALLTKDALTKLVQLALERFAAEVGGRPPRVGRLILTAHSGGGKALLALLEHHDPHQVHVYDALYWPPGPLERWARRRLREDKAALAGGASTADYMATRGGALRVFYQGRVARGTRPHSRALQEALASELSADVARWYRVEASNYDHFQIPRRYGWRVLADASADVPEASAEPSARRQELERDDLEAPPPNDLPDPVLAARSQDALERGWETALPEEDDAEREELLGDGATALAPADELLSPSEGVDLVGEAASPELDWADGWGQSFEPPAGEPEGVMEHHDHDESEELDDALAEVATMADDEARSLSEAVDLSDEGADPELDEPGEGVEAGEVELGEVEAFLEELSPGGLAGEEEAATTVTFPSGATLDVVAGPAGPGEEHYDPYGTGNPLLDTSGPARSTRLSTHFTAGELARSGGKTFSVARIDPGLVRALQRLRDHVGKPVHITSGYRPYLYNVDLYTGRYRKKPTLSRHSSGQAADVKIAGMTGMEIAKAAIDVLGRDVAVGIGGGYAHVDVRGTWARWTYFGAGERNDRAIAEIDAYRRRR
jgi:hypothetical protein